jgi:glycosyltransferase involved in cell wall biosynthesis
MEPLDQGAYPPPGSAVAMARAPLRIGMMIGSTANSGGGVAMALCSLTRALQQRPGTAVEVFSMASSDVVDKGDWAGAKLHHHEVRGPASFAYAPGLNRSLSSRPIDLLHLHGLWMYCSVATRRWAVRSGRPCLISPHGMLDPWALANSGWKKRIARRLYEDDNLRHAACLHALCEPERQAIRDCGLRGPICIVPNGVDPAPEVRPKPPDWRLALPPQAPVLLYLGRLHPKKRVLELLQAWHMAGPPNPGGASAWHLVIAGPGPADYVQLLQNRIAQLGLAERVRLIGPQYGSAKQATFAAADAFVLPSLSEGLPMAALEAWAWGLPALLTPHCNLPEGFAAGAALPIEAEPEGIAAGLRALFGLSGERRRTMGRHGRDLVSARFTWTRVAAEFDSVYRWLLGRGDCSACIDVV